MITYIKKLLQFSILSIISLTAYSAAASVVNTKHNLAHWSPYAYRATTESRVCIFCHTPHNAKPDGALWSHKLSAATTFKKYSSGTLEILKGAQAASGYATGVVTGATKLCLGCHDGLTALGAITTGKGDITITMDIDTLGGSSSGYNEDANTVNIQNKHPVSFKYDAAGAVRDAINAGSKGAKYGLPAGEDNGTSINAEVAKMVAAAGGRIECTICHDPHENNATNDRDLLPFWISGSDDVTGTPFGDLSSYEGVCISCHRQDFGEYTGFSDYTSLR